MTRRAAILGLRVTSRAHSSKAVVVRRSSSPVGRWIKTLADLPSAFSRSCVIVTLRVVSSAGAGTREEDETVGSLHRDA
jgi:hypothetical protein